MRGLSLSLWQIEAWSFVPEGKTGKHALLSVYEVSLQTVQHHRSVCGDWKRHCELHQIRDQPRAADHVKKRPKSSDADA